MRVLDAAGLPRSEVFGSGGVPAVRAASMAGRAVAALAPGAAPTDTVEVGGPPELPRTVVVLRTRRLDGRQGRRP